MDVARVSGDSYSKGVTGTTQKVHKIKLFIGSNCCVKRACFQHEVTGESWLNQALLQLYGPIGIFQN